MNTLPLRAMLLLLNEAGTQRASYSAKKELQRILQELACSKTKKAVQFSKHAGRRTIKKTDINLAISQHK